MSLFETLKLVHVSSALVSVTGFGLRGFWMLSDKPVLRHRVVKVLPHIVDSLLLGSAVWMLFVLKLSPLEQPWLMAKIIALLLYIGLGLMALRFGRSRGTQLAAYVLALLTAGYIISVAYSRSPWGVLQLT